MENVIMMEDSDSFRDMNQRFPYLGFVYKLLLLRMLLNLSRYIPLSGELKDNAQIIRSFIIERILKSDDVLANDRCQNPDFVQCIDSVFLFHCRCLDFFQCVNSIV